MTKEQIVREQYEKMFGTQKYDTSVNRNMNFKYFSPAMDQYAKQQAIDFGGYLGEYGWEILSEPHSEAGKWVSHSNIQYGFKTTEELHTLFLQSTSTNK
jgi:hypothetical protein